MMRYRFYWTPHSLCVLAVPLVGLAVTTSALAQITVTPSVSIAETFTNNVRLSSSNPVSEQITEINPGIRINIAGTRFKTYFDLGLSQVIYAQNSSPNRSQIQNALNTFGTFEAVENWAFVDFSGTISQQAVSAFGTQSNSNTAINDNRTEASNYRVSPYVRGQFGTIASYEARFSQSLSSSDASADTTSTDGSVNLGNASAFGNLGWTAAASRQQVDYSEGRNTEADNLSLGLTYTVNPQVNLSANVGRESSNYTGLEKTHYGTSSVGLNWRPSERTSLSLLSGRRSFGNTHTLSFAHRSARTVWKFTDSQNIITSPNQTGFGSIGNAYDLFDAQFAGLEPDPVARAQLVNNFLQANGISPTSDVVGEFLIAAVSQQRRQNLSFALLGVRDTVTFLMTRTRTSRIDTITSAIDSLTNDDVISQDGYSVNYSHRLTPDASLGVLLSQQDTSGSTSEQESTLTSFSVNLSAKVGRRTSGTLSLYRNKYDSQASPYTETAIRGNLNMQF